ncbi:hypothetical protein PF005_g24204 [Phytophthora fragariae]|uniref:Uncharacterized protein n=2 Tax=Phytophthora TaxID=4783 RepID=A0A6A3HTC3_9STRA|nr:hypothetical protein PF003_g26033 [Phytophthora fragariae]KAE8924769.1 hypothetical protein PF009_g25005 [Phytophthora fragariae]KAE8971614.1 hypothetical protein PF011_g25967 [Phytophthora fragariae]KAE9077134.1 hypothetical protein PF010_g23626 [Phytophthora fragariae]KAE9178138.1 hypothetical protein PF005_g24204 [Phytophthora fragariae]
MERQSVATMLRTPTSAVLEEKGGITGGIMEATTDTMGGITVVGMMEDIMVVEMMEEGVGTAEGMEVVGVTVVVVEIDR